jgi:hypothetical protein
MNFGVLVFFVDIFLSSISGVLAWLAVGMINLSLSVVSRRSCGLKERQYRWENKSQILEVVGTTSRAVARGHWYVGAR